MNIKDIETIENVSRERLYSVIFHLQEELKRQELMFREQTASMNKAYSDLYGKWDKERAKRKQLELVIKEIKDITILNENYLKDKS